MFKKEPPIIISVGGSLIVPNGGIDTKFLSLFNRFIRKYVAQGKRFFLVAGGGKIARHYRDGAKKVVGGITDEDLDWLAIHATRLNAHLLRTIFQDIAHPRIIENYNKKFYRWKEPVVIGAGWKPGWSTDYDAVILARDYGGKVVINLSNTYWVYDKDPNKFKDAKPIEKITWDEMEKLMNALLKEKKWMPGLSAPFDPIATRLAKELKLTVILTNGKDFRNLERLMSGDGFKGTVIMPYRIDAAFYDRNYYKGKKGEYRLKIFDDLTNFYRALMLKIFLKPKNVLDVGCGTGRLVYWLRFLGVDAFGIEISQDALELADKKIKPFLKVGDMTKIPYPEGSFDLVLSYDVLEHIERSKIKKAVSETIRVSKKYIFHKIYTQENHWINLTHGEDFSHISVFSKNYWQNLFSSFPEISVLRTGIFHLPSFFETVFLLRKKTA